MVARGPPKPCSPSSNLGCRAILYNAFFEEYMGYSKEEIVLILRNTLERLKNDPEKFELHKRGLYEYTVIFRSKNEIKIAVDYSSNSNIEVHTGGYYGRMYSSIFSPSWWKAFSAANKIIRALKDKEETIEKNKRMESIYKSFPEIVTQEFEKEVLK